MRSKGRRWLGVDGEGVGRNPHRYVLLACSDGDCIEDRNGLSTVECLEFLLDLGTRDVRVCGYGLSYDWTMILKDLTRKKAGVDAIFRLFRPELRTRSGAHFEYVRWGRYELHWLAGAMWLRDVDKRRRVTIWDVVKYYQCPFVDALREWKVRLDVVDRIEAMKHKRSDFKMSELAKIRRYCLDECEALSALSAENERAHIQADLKPRSWFGPGSTASVLLNRHEIREQRGPLHPLLNEPVARAFFGGWAEIAHHGHVMGPVFGYDLSSAYPAQITNLPCLMHGRWLKVKKERLIKGKDFAHALVRGHIRDVGDVAWAPLPVRLKDGTILHPRSGASGWWWREEWLAAREGWEGLEFEYAWCLQRECDCKPFSFVPEIFARRLAVGKETGEGKVLKLGGNSIYGKLAQSIGKAQFASRAWAGMITSGTRARVLRLMLRHKRLDSILMIATDGVFSTEKHDVDYMVDRAGNKSGAVVLGGWERKEHKTITLVQSGMYWVDDEKVRARGLGRKNLEDLESKAVLMDALSEGVDVPTGWEKVKLSEVWLNERDRFGGARVSILPKSFDDLSQLRCFPHYGEWYAIPSKVSLEAWPKRAEGWKLRELDGVESAAYGTAETSQVGAVAEFRQELWDLTD